MAVIKHISFDFWNTLGIANPEYAKRRKEILSEYSETILSDGRVHRHTPDYCRSAYASVKDVIDNSVRRGTHYSNDECFTVLADWLEMDDPFHYIMTLMKGELWKAFHENPPTILPETIAELHRLKEKGVTLSIGSNTNFIPGKVIRDAVLDRLKLFDFFVFSDEFGISKPNMKFFQHINKQSYDLKGAVGKNIVHIGDSQVFDFIPAYKFGLGAAYVEDPTHVVEVLNLF